VVLDLGSRFYDYKALVIRLNHSKLAEAVCSWAGVPPERRHNVAEVGSFFLPVSEILTNIFAHTFTFFIQFLSSTLVQHWPNKADRKSQWSLIRGQLLQV
jgi:eukaryotic translation initiation factor 2-alpha kinase 4